MHLPRETLIVIIKNSLRNLFIQVRAINGQNFDLVTCQAWLRIAAQCGDCLILSIIICQFLDVYDLSLVIGVI